jgi:hypothetical protein
MTAGIDLVLMCRAMTEEVGMNTQASPILRVDLVC